MDFSEIVLQHLQPFFVKYNLTIEEQRANYLKLVCKKLVIVIAYDHLERSNTLWIGKKENEKESIEIDDQALEQFFNSDIKLSQVPTETFIKNLVRFFNNEGQPLLIGNQEILSELEKFDFDRSRKYTQELILKQNLAAADKAWNEHNYQEFIKIIDEIDSTQLSTSDKMKYEIATKEISP